MMDITLPSVVTVVTSQYVDLIWL